MQYQFPVIRNISDVLPAIADTPEFGVTVKDGYTVINYKVQSEDMFPPIKVAGGSAKMREERSLHNALRRECRGIIFDTETGNIIRRPFHKFFNVGEREETLERNVNLSNGHAILEKLDGSMCSVFAHEGKLIWGTKMVAQDFHEMIEEFVKESDIDYEGFCWVNINLGYTPIFEWMHPQKRIVIDYGKEPTLVLTAIRNMVTGAYVRL